MSKTTLNKTFDGSVVAETLNIKMSGPITINAKKGSVVLKNGTGDEYTFVIPRGGTWASPWIHGANKLGLELSYKGKTHMVELTIKDKAVKDDAFDFFRNKLPAQKGGVTRRKKMSQCRKTKKTCWRL